MMPLPPNWVMPDPLPPVSVEMLKTAMAVGSTAAAGHGLVAQKLKEDPPGFGVEDDDGNMRHYRFGDTPLTRFLLSVKDLCPLDPDQRTALCLRAWRLMDAIYDRRFRDYVRHTDNPEIHEYDDALAKVMANIFYPLHDGPKMQDILREVRKRESQGPQSDLFGGA